MSVSSTVIAYINNKGGIKSKKCNEIGMGIWLWCFKNNYFFSLAHIPGKHGAIALSYPLFFIDDSGTEFHVD